MIPSYYFDTSVLGGYFDDEFRQATRTLWTDLLEGRCRAIFSSMTLAELAPAPIEVRRLFGALPGTCYDVIIEREEILELAGRYVEAGVVSEASRPDALHVAFATFSSAKAIVSWNFKHLANIRRIESFNGVNLLMGYRLIDIRTPWEVIEL